MSGCRVFISSVYHGLVGLRQRMKKEAEDAGLVAWIFEEVNELCEAPPQKSQKVCLDNINASNLYVAVFHRGWCFSASAAVAL